MESPDNPPEEASPPSSPLSSPPSVSTMSTLSIRSSPKTPSTIRTIDASLRYPSPSSSLSSLESSLQPESTSHPLRIRLKLAVTTKKSTLSRLPSTPSGKRWRAPPRNKDRAPEHLDLQTTIQGGCIETDPLVRRLVHVLRHKKKIVVVAGAGISVSAGVPDFRSARGLFKSAGKELFDASVYKHNDSTESFHKMVCELGRLSRQAKPTEFHHMLAALGQEGRLMRLYSQNVDGIDTALEPLRTNVPLNQKGPWPKTIQLHGGLDKMVCTKCNELQDFDPALFDGPEPPLCGSCEAMEIARSAGDLRGRGIGRLRPRMVLYNEYNPDADAIGKVSEADLRRGADAVIVVGTSLKIPGVRRLVKELCLKTRSRRDGFTAWINIDAEPQGADFKDCFDMVVQGSSEDVAVLAGLPRWNSSGEYQILSEGEALRLRQESEGRGKVEICIEPVVEAEYDVEGSDRQYQGAVIGIPTPGASPKLAPRDGQDRTKLELLVKDEGDEAFPPAAAAVEKKPGRGQNGTAAKRTALPTQPTKRAPTTRRKRTATAKKPTVQPSTIFDTFKACKTTGPAPGKPPKKASDAGKPAKSDVGTTTRRPKRKATEDDDKTAQAAAAVVKRPRVVAGALPALRPSRERVGGAVSLAV